MSSIADTSMLGSTMDGLGSEDNTLCFNDSDFYLNMDDVDIGPQIGQGAFSKVYLGRYLGELIRLGKYQAQLTASWRIITTTASGGSTTGAGVESINLHLLLSSVLLS
eukprot:jgi/Undpi1/4042/HiC_scaffold_16.g07409.m1